MSTHASIDSIESLAKICSLDEEPHLNTCFKHFIFFTLHFNLVEEKELAPLQELIDQFTGKVKAEPA
eukprot:gene21484-28460_t